MKQVNTMKGCNRIRVMIDEADKPELLSFEVNQHIRLCGECSAFAEQRAGLRKLLGVGPRVAAPMNFDALLNARLAEAKRRRSFAWLGSGGYLRLGAATAGLAVMVFAAQYAGLFSERNRQVNAPQPVAEAPDVAPIPTPPSLVGPQINAIAPAVADASTPPRVSRGVPISASARTRTYPATEDDGVVLVRGTNGDLDVPMPTVSVGAQPLLYVTAGRAPARNAGASF